MAGLSAQLRAAGIDDARLEQLIDFCATEAELCRDDGMESTAEYHESIWRLLTMLRDATNG